MEPILVYIRIYIHIYIYIHNDTYIHVHIYIRNYVHLKKNFSGIHNSRNGLFVQIFLKRAVKPSAGNTSAGFP